MMRFFESGVQTIECPLRKTSVLPQSIATRPGARRRTAYYTLVHGEVREAAEELMRAFTGVYRRREAREMAMTVAEKLQREGRMEGKAEGKIESVITFLEIRFNEVPASLQKKLRSLRDGARIEKALKQAAVCQSLKEFQKAL